MNKTEAQRKVADHVRPWLADRLLVAEVIEEVSAAQAPAWAFIIGVDGEPLPNTPPVYVDKATGRFSPTPANWQAVPVL